MAPDVLLWLAVGVGLYMAWNIGANDVANAMGTSVGSGALTFRRAIIVAAVFEFLGAVLVGGTVTETVRDGIVDSSAFVDQPLLLVAGMCAALMSAAIWLHLATYMGWPVSTTHAIVGAVAGFGIVHAGFSAVTGGKLVAIVSSWVISPIFGALIGGALFLLVSRRILDADDPADRMRRYGPFLVLPIFAILTLSFIYKGLKNLKLDLGFGTALGIALAVGFAAAGIAAWNLRKMKAISGAPPRVQLAMVESRFAVLQVMTACLVAFAHGSNDVANAVGPMAAVVGTLQTGAVATKVGLPMWVLLVGAIGIVAGLATYGQKVMRTIGHNITEMTPSRGFTAEFAAAATILVGSKLGMPISTTHTLVGSVIGVGLARGISALDIGVLRGIVASWFITVPFAAILSGGIFYVMSLMM